MGRASTDSGAADSPQTCCTTCRTVFEVSPELLSSSDTRVRCGECLSIFDALANLRDPEEALEEALASESPASDTPPGPSSPASDASVDHDASDDTADAAELAELARLADETGSLDVTYSDFDLFSDDAQLPEVAYLDETTDTPDFDFDSVDVDEDEEETFSDMLFAHDATIEPGALVDADADVGDGDGTAAFGGNDAWTGGASGAHVDADDPDFIDDDEPVEPLVFRYRDAEESVSGRRAGRNAGAAEDVIAGVGTGADTGDVAAPASAATASANLGAAAGDAADVAPVPGLGEKYASPPQPGTPWLLRSLLLLVLGGLLAGLYAYRERDSLHNDPLTRPVLLVACRAIGCEVPSRVELASLKLLERKVFTHPTEPNALVINVAFRNSAAFDQRYPVLVVRLRDRLGGIVAERDFAPSDYLDTWVPGDTLEAARRLDISLEVDDPGDGAESYEFEFREASD